MHTHSSTVKHRQVLTHADGELGRHDVIQLALHEGVKHGALFLSQHAPRLEKVARAAVELKLGVVELQRQV